MPRKCFYSFHYKPDCHRAAMIRNIGVIEGNRPAPDNDWEAIERGGDRAIERWIADQMVGRSCAIVLVGANTANRKWINHEIVSAWDKGMGVAGVRVHGINSMANGTSSAGPNPFDYITYSPTGRPLSSIVKCYDPPGADSRSRYGWISDNIDAIADEAIRIRKAH